MIEESFRRVLRRELDEYYDGLCKALVGLTADERRVQVGGEANHIDFLVWHMARNEDETISACSRTEELWRQGEWYRRWNLPEIGDGCGYTVEDVRRLPQIHPSDLDEYFGEVRARTNSFLEGITSTVIDELVWEDNPDVTVGQILGHLVVEQSQHLGQVAFIRGLQRGLEFTTSWNNPDTPTPA